MLTLERRVVGCCCDGCGCCGGGNCVDNWGNVGNTDGAVFIDIADGRFTPPGCRAPGTEGPPAGWWMLIEGTWLAPESGIAWNS